MSGSVEFDEDVVLAKASTVRACLATIRDLESPGRADLEKFAAAVVAVTVGVARQ